MDSMAHRLHQCLLALVIALVLAPSVIVSTPSAADAQRLRRASGAVRGGNRSRTDTPRRSRRASRFGPRRTQRAVERYRYVPIIVASPYEVTFESQDELPEREFLAITVTGEGQYVFHGIGSVGAALRVGFPFGFELHVAYHVYFEPLPDRTDAIALGRIGIAWRILDLDEVQVRLGMAFRQFIDIEGSLMGAETFGGADFFPIEPLVLSLEGGAGNVGEALVLQVRATAGLVAGPIEVYAGWEHVMLQPFGGRAGVSLTGPVFGVRSWL